MVLRPWSRSWARDPPTPFFRMAVSSPKGRLSRSTQARCSPTTWSHNSEMRTCHRFSIVSDEIGLPDMSEEYDNSAASLVADANTQVVIYWDEKGTHTYSVYALGIAPDQANASTAAFAKLLTALDQAAAKANAVPYQPERVRVLAGVGQIPVDPLFEDIREWPTGLGSPADWSEIDFGWSCKVLGAEVLDHFTDASQLTRWLHPDQMMDASPFHSPGPPPPP